MKKVIYISVLAILFFACKKLEYSPEGPTDVRIENLSGQTWYEVIVNTSGGLDTFDIISPGDTSGYLRFDKAFNVADISTMINCEKYATDSVDYTGLTYIGQAKITYQVSILSVQNKKLKIINCSLDAPLD
ncbi:MAG: hypothetical protein NTZ85_03285 [Bacteroidia bacterium]|nr:hypothetical protein [Bacteroidia bacterium]